jgi:hypothetical protein
LLEDFLGKLQILQSKALQSKFIWKNYNHTKFQTHLLPKEHSYSLEQHSTLSTQGNGCSLKPLKTFFPWGHGCSLGPTMCSRTKGLCWLGATIFLRNKYVLKFFHMNFDWNVFNYKVVILIETFPIIGHNLI